MSNSRQRNSHSTYFAPTLPYMHCIPLHPPASPPSSPHHPRFLHLLFVPPACGLQGLVYAHGGRAFPQACGPPLFALWRGVAVTSLACHGKRLPPTTSVVVVRSFGFGRGPRTQLASEPPPPSNGRGSPWLPPHFAGLDPLGRKA